MAPPKKDPAATKKALRAATKAASRAGKRGRDVDAKADAKALLLQGDPTEAERERSLELQRACFTGGGIFPPFPFVLFCRWHHGPNGQAGPVRSRGAAASVCALRLLPAPPSVLPVPTTLPVTAFPGGLAPFFCHFSRSC